MDDKALSSRLLEIPFSEATKAALVAKLFGHSNRSPSHQSLSSPGLELDAYWAFYARECTRALHNAGRHVAVRNHQDVVDCIQKLKDGILREDLNKDIRAKLTTFHANSDEMVESSVNLAATLLLMTSFCSYEYGFTGRSQLCWNGTMPLKEFVAAYFDPSQLLKDARVKLEKIFTARNLGKVAGLDIVWTDNLADHLRLTDDDTRVHIFHHASFLEAQKQSPDSLLPEGLAEETLRTLALLFPSGDPATRKWILKVVSSEEHESLDRRITQCGRLSTDNRQIDRFRYWRDRLVTLKQVFDEAQPTTLSRWWYDRRNGVQWYTFWVAVMVLVLTVFFGLVQSVEGALQVYASFKSMNEPGDGGGGVHGRQINGPNT